jgi:hypothetical protein
LRAAAVVALGRQVAASAVGALVALVSDRALQGDVGYALARSPNPLALGALEVLSVAPESRRLAARAYFVRRFVRGDRSARLDALVASLAASADADDRAVGLQVSVALGELRIERAIVDADARVRRAVTMGAMAHADPDTLEAILARLKAEPDEPTRRVLALGLLDGDARNTVPTSALVEWASAGGPDAPLAARAIARRASDTVDGSVVALLVSRDAVLRRHAALGLGASGARDATGHLARMYAWEWDAGVRRAVIEALGGRTNDQGTPERIATLELAARLDPDPVVRWRAKLALDGSPPPSPGRIREVAWVRLVPVEGASRVPDATALLVPRDGPAVPIAFDNDGYALLPGVAPGEVCLRLADGLPAYSAPVP